MSNLSDAEFKTLVIRMLKGLNEDLNSMKKIQTVTKGTLQVPSLHDREGFATGPYRTLTTLDNTTKTQSQRSST